MRRQENDALAGRPGRLDMLPAGDFGDQRYGLVQRTHPDARQFDHLLAGFGRHGTAQGSVDTGLRHVFPKVPAIGRRQPIDKPAECSAQGVQQGKRQQGKQAEEKNHEAPGVDSP